MMVENADVALTTIDAQQFQASIEIETETQDYSHIRVTTQTSQLTSEINAKRDVEQSATKPTRRKVPLLTTRKSSANEFARQGKVFILIVQEEDLRSQLTQINRYGIANQVKRQANKRRIAASNLPSDDAIKPKSKFTIPLHIRHLVDILESHRIEYTIDTSRFGLPAQLIADQNNGGNLQYPVIVVDNFLRYTKLNRWIRDQLDRHCRSNQIGVLTYLLHDPGHEKLKVSNVLIENAAFNYHKKRRSAQSDTISGNSNSSTETTAEQFPITFMPIIQNCRNQTSNCLVNYEVNTKSKILRLVKQKPRFVVREELSPNFDNSPILTLSSNHASYEPIAWASMRATEIATSSARQRRFAPATMTTPVVGLDRTGDGKTRSHTQKKNYKSGEDNQIKRAAELVKRAVLVGGDRQTPLVVDRQAGNGTDGLGNDSYAVDYLHADQTDEQVEEGGENSNPAYIEFYQQHAENDQLEGQAELTGHGTRPSSWPSAYAGVPSDEPLDETQVDEKYIVSMLDNGHYDGIRRVLFGTTNQHWLDRLLVIDALEHLSSGKIITPLERYIQIDIDDIFVGERGIRLHESDVRALIAVQKQFAQTFFGGQFKFNLGFSGKYYRHGNKAENLGDELLVNQADEFTWFCHFWSHAKAHLFNTTKAIEDELLKNLDFARQHKLPIINQSTNGTKMLPTYAVAPHHSGGKLESSEEESYQFTFFSATIM